MHVTHAKCKVYLDRLGSTLLHTLFRVSYMILVWGEGGGGDECDLIVVGKAYCNHRNMFQLSQMKMINFVRL